MLLTPHGAVAGESGIEAGTPTSVRGVQGGTKPRVSASCRRRVEFEPAGQRERSCRTLTYCGQEFWQ